MWLLDRIGIYRERRYLYGKSLKIINMMLFSKFIEELSRNRWLFCLFVETLGTVRLVDPAAEWLQKCVDASCKAA